MPTKVLDLDLNSLPDTISGLDGYLKALALLRWRGRPVGQASLPVDHGQITRAQVLRTISQPEEELLDGEQNEIWKRVDQLLLYDYLEWDEVDIDLPVPGPVTVAVCTRDRPDDLRRCLQAFMSLPDDGQEYLVIDNCPSSNETQQICASYGERVRYVREDRPGLDVARNRALREAKFEIIVFNDDDAVPDSGWLRALVRNFRDPMVLCVTGLTMPLELETKAQEWFEFYSPFNRGFKRKVFNWEVINPVAAVKVGVGANMALRRSVLDLVGPFDEALDSGTATQSGGDVQMFTRIIRRGYRITYDPAALSWHRHRRDWNGLRKTLYGYGVGVYATFTYNLVYEREFYVLVEALNWLGMVQFPNFLRGILRRPNSLPFDLVWAELRGCLAGPWAYFRSRRAAGKYGRANDQQEPVSQHSYSNS